MVQILERASVTHGPATSEARDSHVVIANVAEEPVEDPNQINWREIIEQANNIEDDHGLNEQELQAAIPVMGPEEEEEHSLMEIPMISEAVEEVGMEESKSETKMVMLEGPSDIEDFCNNLVID